MKHTSGAWIVEEDPSGILVTSQTPGLCVSVTVPGRKATAEDRANARLIAAAPELLEALQSIAKGYSGEVGVNSQGLSGTDCADIARAAIAKATGAA